MNRFIKAILPIATLTFASCSDGTHKQTTSTPINTTFSPRLSDLFWLSGNWEMATGGGIIYEKWTIGKDSSLSGTSGFISGTDTTLSETIALQLNGDAIMYIPTVKDQNNGMPVPFKLTKAEGDSFVFENPQHDFPSKITYRKISATSLTATISGNAKGTPRSETFEMNKTH